MGDEFQAQLNNAALARSANDESSMATSSQEQLRTPNALFDAGRLAESNNTVRDSRAVVMLEAFVSAVERLERTLDRETEVLRQRKPIALHDFNHEKRHGLLELSRTMAAMRAFDPSLFEYDARAPLVRLRVKLERNLAILQTHLTAVGEIAAIVARAIQDHESDGTYTAALVQKGSGR